MKDLFLENARVIDPAAGLDRKANILIRAGKIAAVDPAEAPADAERLDLSGRIAALVKRGHAELIVQFPLLRIAQDIIRLIDLLELLLCLSIVRITVRVKLPGLFPVCFFDILVRCVSAAPENLIIITFCSHLISPPSFLILPLLYTGAAHSEVFNRAGGFPPCPSWFVAYTKAVRE